MYRRQKRAAQEFAMSELSPILVLQIKTSKFFNDAAKVNIKSEKLTPFGGIFHIIELFEALLSETIYSTLGVRCHRIGFYFLGILEVLQFLLDVLRPKQIATKLPHHSCSDSSPCLPSGSERQGSTNSTFTPTSLTTLFGNTDRLTSFADALV